MFIPTDIKNYIKNILKQKDLGDIYCLIPRLQIIIKKQTILNPGQLEQHNILKKMNIITQLNINMYLFNEKNFKESKSKVIYYRNLK